MQHLAGGTLLPFPEKTARRRRGGGGRRALSETLARALTVVQLLEHHNPDALPAYESLGRVLLDNRSTPPGGDREEVRRATRDLVETWRARETAFLDAIVSPRRNAIAPPLFAGPGRGPKFWILDGADNGIPVATFEEWDDWHETHARERIIAENRAPGGRWMVVTSFRRAIMEIAIGEAPPLFETVVYGGTFHGMSDLYPTRTRAYLGHCRMVSFVEHLSGTVVHLAKDKIEIRK